MARGGHRQGQPGRAYPNRHDLTQAPTAAPGQEYGQAKAQLDAQKVVPLPQAAGPVAASPGTPTPPSQPGPAVTPLDAPTARPDEPLTAGLPFGPGPGPEALPPTAAPDDVGNALRALFQASGGDPNLATLIELHDRGY